MNITKAAHSYKLKAIRVKRLDTESQDYINNNILK